MSFENDDFSVDFTRYDDFASAGDVAFDHPGSPDDFYGARFVFDEGEEALHAEGRGFSSAFTAEEGACGTRAEDDFRILSGTGVGDECLKLGGDSVFWTAGEGVRGFLSSAMDALWQWAEGASRR